ncbi:MAG: ankyrin repeat domain-containing protein [Rhodospirillaceae bacterium]
MTDKTKMTPDDFMLLAQRGDRDGLAAAIDAGMKINTIDAHGNSALMYAAAAGQTKTCRWLIEQGIDKATVNNWGLSAREWSKWPTNADDIRKLVY